MEHAQVPRDGHPQAGRRHGRPLPPRPPALDRQLRPPLRLHLRLPPQLRPPPIRHLRRQLRPAEEDHPGLDLPGLRHLPLRRAPPPLLRHAHPRLRDLQVLQLHPHHQGLLRGPEHRSDHRQHMTGGRWRDDGGAQWDRQAGEGGHAVRRGGAAQQDEDVEGGVQEVVVGEIHSTTERIFLRRKKEKKRDFSICD